MLLLTLFNKLFVVYSKKTVFCVKEFKSLNRTGHVFHIFRYVIDVVVIGLKANCMYSEHLYFSLKAFFSASIPSTG